MNKLSVTGEAFDIPSMKEMSIEEYQQYLEEELLFVDPTMFFAQESAVFRFAATPEQAKALMTFLEGQLHRIGR